MYVPPCYSATAAVPHDWFGFDAFLNSTKYASISLDTRVCTVCILRIHTCILSVLYVAREKSGRMGCDGTVEKTRKEQIGWAEGGIIRGNDKQKDFPKQQDRGSIPSALMHLEARARAKGTRGPCFMYVGRWERGGAFA